MTVRKTVSFDSEIFIKGGVYYYRGTPFGHRKRLEKSLGLKEGALQREVLRVKKETLESLERVGTSGGRNSFSVLSQRYVESRLSENLSESTRFEIRSIINSHFVPFFKAIKVEEFDQPLFTEYCLFKKKSNLNLVNHRKIMNHFLKWCVQNGYLKYRPELEIPKAAHRERREREVLTASEIKSILSINEPRTLLYLALYLFHGMRNMEILKLRWDEVDLEKRGLFINRMSNRRRKARAIPVNDFALELLKAIKSKSKSDWVFPSRKKGGKYPHINPVGGFRKPWKRALKAAKITRDITPHDLRSTFETFMHTRPDFTDTQREKMAGAKIDVQKDHYVKMQIDQLRGLEESVQVDGLEKVIAEKISDICGAKIGAKQSKSKMGNATSRGKKARKGKR